jgi:hypothetical protein
VTVRATKRWLFWFFVMEGLRQIRPRSRVCGCVLAPVDALAALTFLGVLLFLLVLQLALSIQLASELTCPL